jgi:hypothetical protein
MCACRRYVERDNFKPWPLTVGNVLEKECPLKLLSAMLKKSDFRRKQYSSQLLNRLTAGGMCPNLNHDFAENAPSGKTGHKNERSPALQI